MTRRWPLLLAVTFLRSYPSSSQSQPEDPGAYQAGWTQQIIQRGDRSLNCRIYYPAFTEGSEAPIDTIHGPYPIVAFGHGFFMQTGYYLSHFKHLATHGFVVIAPQFPDTQHGELADDLLFCVEHIRQQHATPTSRYFGLIDTERVGLSGHSMGGGASLLAASRDPRIDVVAPLAAAETTPSAIAAMPLIRGFVYLITGGSDGITPPVQNQIPMYNNANPVKGLPIINGANHTRFMDFAGFDFTDPNGNLTRPQQLLITRRYLTSVFRLLLKQEPSYWVYAFGDSAANDTRLTFSWAGRALSPMPFELVAPSGVINNGMVSFRWHRTTTLNPQEPILYSVHVASTPQFTDTVAFSPPSPDSNWTAPSGFMAGETYFWRVRARTSDSTSTLSSVLSFSPATCAYPETRTWLRLSEEGAGFDTLWIGFATTATCSVDAHLCEFLSVPCDPAGWFCTQLFPVCFTEPWSTMGSHDYRPYVGAGTIDTFKVRFQKQDLDTPIVVRWSWSEMATLYDSIIAQDMFGGLVFRARLDATDSLMISNPTISDFYTFGYGQKNPTHAAEGRDANLPDTPVLLQNYPNPFNPTTTLSFTIPFSSFTILKVHDILGREVTTLVNEVKQPGTYYLRWDAEGLSSGMYFCTLQAGSFRQTLKIILSR